MSDYLKSEEKFVNPYHFVPLQEGCLRERVEYKKRKGKLTGWIDCRLETLGPVFIPNTSGVVEEKGEKKSDVFGKRAIRDGKEVVVNSYDFFSYRDLSKQAGETPTAAKVPVIPGSEIRGVIRSAFEAVTNSCLSTIDDGQQLYKRVQSPAKPGHLVYDRNKKEWRLFQCGRYRLSKKILKVVKGDITINNEKYREGEPVYVQIDYKNFKVVKISRNQEQRLKKGFLHIGEYNENKNYESVYIHRTDKKTNREEVVNVQDRLVPQMLNNLVENVLLYRDKANKTENHHQYRHFDKSCGEIKSISRLVRRFDEGQIDYTGFMEILQREYKAAFAYLNGALVNTVRYGSRYYLCPAMIGREVFYNKLTDLVGDYTPCQEINHLCPACALFGLAGRKEAVASRVRFTDAQIAGEAGDPADYYGEVRILKELASPKLSATEFYLERNPDYADLWNYDYAVNWNSHRFGVPGYRPRIRGRKFYWHHRQPNPYVDKDKENDPDWVSDRNVAVRPLKAGIPFRFKIYFNNISEKELKRLLWVLEIGGKKQGHGHKIGMAKPLGLGSIGISAAGVFVRELSGQNNTIEYNTADQLESYEDFVSMTPEDLGCSQEVWDSYLKLTKLEPPFEPIQYPQNEGKVENYLWFVANKQFRGTGTSPVIEQTLPPIGDTPWLYKYREKQGR
jgi:CRISPR-associated protein (TIGR03986 family)